MAIASSVAFRTSSLSMPPTTIEPASKPSGRSVEVLIKTPGNCSMADSSVKVPESDRTHKAFFSNLTYSNKPNGLRF